MENINKWIDAQANFQVHEGITTDAVHRRFKNKKGSETDDYFYCKQCDVRIEVSQGKEELKSHFKNIRHQSCNNCVYCSKPVYQYHYRGDIQLYHRCPPS